MATIKFDTAAIARNYEKLKVLSAPSAVIAFIKADGYGAGIGVMTDLLARAGADTVACARPADALYIKNTHPQLRVLLTSACDYAPTLGQLIAAGVVVTVSGLEGFRTACTCRTGENLAINVAVDSGMGRFGLRGEEIELFCREYKNNKNIQIVSTFTHFANCFGGKKGEKATRRQWERFCDAVETMRGLGVDPGILHAANSAATLLYPEFRADAVRCGSALLGRCVGAQSAGLEKVGRLCAQVLTVRNIHAGESVGYGSVFTAKREMTVAVIDAGHADGLFLQRRHDGLRPADRLYNVRRDLSAQPLTCRIDGHSAKVVGRVGLTNLVAEVSGFECAAGMEAEFDFNPIFCAAKEISYD